MCRKNLVNIQIYTAVWQDMPGRWKRKRWLKEPLDISRLGQNVPSQFDVKKWIAITKEYYGMRQNPRRPKVRQLYDKYKKSIKNRDWLIQIFWFLAQRCMTINPRMWLSPIFEKKILGQIWARKRLKSGFFGLSEKLDH